jgi:predicted RNase H-like nuclease
MEADGNTAAHVGGIEVAGIDVWKGRWVAVRLRGGRFHGALMDARLSDLLATLGDVAAVGIDMPIGLTSGRERRDADREARAFVGPRRGSVFPTYPRDVYLAEPYAEARRVCLELTGISISSQAYALRTRLLEVEAALPGSPDVREVHPEVSFRAMAGRHLTWPKSSWNGSRERVGLLEREGIVVPALLESVGNAGSEDVLDAAAVAWSAHRIASGAARTLPENPGQRAGGRPLAIWY